MGYGAPQGPAPQMGFDGPPPMRQTAKRSFQDMQQQFGGDEYMQHPPMPSQPQWPQGQHVQNAFQSRPRRQQHPVQPHLQQQTRPSILSRIGN